MQPNGYAILMAVMVPMPREKWTDERLDDLNEKVDDLKKEMREGFARVDEDIRELRREIQTINRNMIGGLFVIVVAIIGSNAF